ncbi:hypothetical protein N658DRAFT_27009 [Parathielavia hyrcaniae]|uniref:Uncharacterized protein n=1 Tax=Parathielavia hyrcaniae TaxID=113614 RepID=A0AAN6QFX8_9PEZI|nr:hypothetical protein N658DRAFT_27009 [Parathielavia hyrcaniae]
MSRKWSTIPGVFSEVSFAHTDPVPANCTRPRLKLSASLTVPKAAECSASVCCPGRLSKPGSPGVGRTGTDNYTVLCRVRRSRYHPYLQHLQLAGPRWMTCCGLRARPVACQIHASRCMRGWLQRAWLSLPLRDGVEGGFVSPDS